MILFFVILTNVRHSRGVCRHFMSKIQVLLLYIKSLYETMVIDFLTFTSRPSARKWSLISFYLYQDPLRGNGHWFPYVTSRPSTKQWSWLFSSSRYSTRQWSLISLHQDLLRGNGHRSLYIKTLSEAMVIDSYVTLRPFARQWSSISLHQDPLRGNDH